MTIEGPVPQLPVDDTAIQLLTDMAKASITGDTEALAQTLQDWATLTPTKRSELEVLLSLVMPPWILPMQMFTIFAEPEKYMGVTRLSGGDVQDFARMLADATTSSIVLSALVKWAQSEQAIADSAKEDVKNDAKTATSSQSQATTSSSAQTTPVQTSSVSNSPINAMLAAYIAGHTPQGVATSGSAGGTESTDTTSTMQFLRNNPILLAGLQTADPALAGQAFDIAMSQITISCLDRFIESQAILRQLQIDDDKRREAQGQTPRDRLRDDIYSDIKNGATPLSQVSFLALQTLLINAGVFQVGATGATAPISGAELAANITSITSTETGLLVARDVFRNDLVATSVMASIPSLFEERPDQLTGKEQLTELAQLASTITQMVPYWTIPAAVSFQNLAAPNGGAKTIPESAVRAFVAGIVAMINDPAFALMIQNAILRNASDPTRITAEQLKAYTAAIKIALLATATVALYKVYMNKTPDELAKLFGISISDAEKLRFDPQLIADLVLGGDSPLTGAPLLEELVKMMREILENIPKENRESFIYNLFGSFHPDTPVEQLMDPSNQFLGLCEYVGSSQQRG